MSSSSSVLLRGGVVLLHDEHEHVKPAAVDVLVTGNTIASVGAGLQAPAGTEIVDCKDKIISPGFISTHNHLWQTQLKGRHANETLFQYMTSGVPHSGQYDKADIVWGQLAGCLEAIDAGTTTVVDHSHMNQGTDYAPAAIAATVSSGIRAVYAYSPTLRLQPTAPYVANPTILEDWALPTLEALAAKAPFGANGRVRLGLGFDWFFLPNEMVKPFFDRVAPLKLALVTSHDPRDIFWGASNGTRADSHGLMNGDLLLSHSNSITPAQAETFAKAGVHITSSTSTELQMAFGPPLALNPDYESCERNISLSVDCHSNNPNSILHEMRLLLQNARANRANKLIARGEVPRNVPYTVEHAFNLGTLAGARAVKMEGRLGTIKAGAVADLLVFDGLSPALLGAAQHDPLAAVVMHSSPADLVHVLVDGVFRKRGGRILPIVPEGPEAVMVLGATPVEWPTVARAIVTSRERIQRQIDGIDIDEVSPAWLKIWGIDASKFVEDKA